MSLDQIALNFLSENTFIVLLAAFIIICILLGVRIVPQSEKFVVERFGRLRSVLGPGINLIVPFLDKVAQDFHSGTSASQCDAGRDYRG
jgi:regulator of protease activity HflC (stomatin/prohibitin superfamily)